MSQNPSNDKSKGIEEKSTEKEKKKDIENAKNNDDKWGAVKAALKTIKQSHGEGALMRMQDVVQEKVGSVSTGSLSLDIATGIGGIPKGRVTEIYGPEGSGKTTLALNIIANSQKSGGICAYIDVEHALDPRYAHKLGVNIEDLIISQPENAEQALEIADTLIRSGGIDVVVIDSVAALVPKSELEGEMGDQSMGVQARLMSKCLLE